MNTMLNRPFNAMGARLAMHEVPLAGHIRVDVKADLAGSFFEIHAGPDVRVVVPQVRPDMRHLFLLADTGSAKHKFLCGHDERHWFAAAVPNARGVSDVVTAMDALKPLPVWWEIRRKRVSASELTRRRTRAYIRQGEWFFVAETRVSVPPLMIREDEPIRRGNGKPHRAQYAYRINGELRYVSPRWRMGVTEEQYRNLLRNHREARKQKWETALVGAALFVKGRVSHADHATIVLDGWHQVFMNTENQAPSMRHLAFLD